MKYVKTFENYNSTNEILAFGNDELRKAQSLNNEFTPIFELITEFINIRIKMFHDKMELDSETQELIDSINKQINISLETGIISLHSELKNSLNIFVEKYSDILN